MTVSEIFAPEADVCGPLWGKSAATGSCYIVPDYALTFAQFLPIFCLFGLDLLLLLVLAVIFLNYFPRQQGTSQLLWFLNVV